MRYKKSRRSSVAEHVLGKDGASGSIPLGGTIPERFWSKVSKHGFRRCWPWKASRDRHGYGQFKPGSYQNPKRAHRVAWELSFGPIPAGLAVCHHCDNPACCNPNHLFVGTHRGNMLDKARKGRIVRGMPNGTTLHGMRIAEARRKRTGTEA